MGFSTHRGSTENSANLHLGGGRWSLTAVSEQGVLFHPAQL